MLKAERLYPSDLSNQQWNAIREFVPSARRGGRPRTTDIREVINAVFYLNRTGCAWRYLPINYPPWKTVYDYFSRWRQQGIWKQIHNHIRNELRQRDDRNAAATVLIIDSQSVRAHYGESRGYDGFKKLRGRKRHILVDTLGLIHSLKVHSANLSDRSQGHALFAHYPQYKRTRLEAVYADHGYRGKFVEDVQWDFGFKPCIPRLRKNSGQGIRKTTKEKLANRRLRKLPKKRWIVERTFAWFNHYRRLSRDYEKKTTHSESMIYLAMTQLMLRRLDSQRGS